MRYSLISIFILISLNIAAQNIGVGTTSPLEKLDVNGNTRANTFIITIGGAVFDFLVKNNATGEIGYRKGHGGLGINFIICTTGVFPMPNVLTYADKAPNAVLTETNILCTVRIIAANIIPKGWAPCNGQLLSISQNQGMFAILGTTYGGNGITTFALPDFRAMAPVGQGTNPAGYLWGLGQKSD